MKKSAAILLAIGPVGFGSCGAPHRQPVVTPAAEAVDTSAADRPAISAAAVMVATSAVTVAAGTTAAAMAATDMALDRPRTGRSLLRLSLFGRLWLRRYPGPYYDDYSDEDAVPSPNVAPGAPPAAVPGTWYHCDSPAGFYPYVATCAHAWQPVPASPPPPPPPSQQGSGD